METRVRHPADAYFIILNLTRNQPAKNETFKYCLLFLMCMNISKIDLLRVNKGFGGGLRSDSSLDFAIDRQKSKKLGDCKKLAYLWRAILVDHPFTDGNKRTAMFLAFQFAEEHKKKVDNKVKKEINFLSCKLEDMTR